ncbi:unnamed protein product [Victoria cruziana]
MSSNLLPPLPPFSSISWLEKGAGQLPTPSTILFYLTKPDNCLLGLLMVWEGGWNHPRGVFPLVSSCVPLRKAGG